MSKYLLHAILAVEEWHEKQPEGRTIMPKEASAEIKAMFDSKVARAGCGPAKVSAILIEFHGWVKSGRLLYLPPSAVQVNASEDVIWST